MSLTSRLDDKLDVVRIFFEERFPRTSDVTRQANSLLRTAETMRPKLPVPWTTAGAAFDYMARYCLRVTPSDRLIAWQGAIRASDQTMWRPVKENAWVGIKAREGGPAMAKGSIEEFFQGLDSTLEELRPSARRLDRGEQELLGRYCFVLALFDECFRSGNRPESLLFSTGTSPTVDALLHLAGDHCIDDLCNLLNLFADNIEQKQFTEVVLNPNFEGSRDIGGADADLILDGCLLEFKSTVKASVQKSWIYQLLGYALLDYRDQYGLSHLGFYMARQGEFMEWPIENLLEMLSDKRSPSLSDVRRDFQCLLKK